MTLSVRRRPKSLVQATDSHSSPGWTVLAGQVLREDHPAVRNAPNLFAPAPEEAVDQSDHVRREPLDEPVVAEPAQRTVRAIGGFQALGGFVFEGDVVPADHPVVAQFPGHFEPVKA